MGCVGSPLSRDSSHALRVLEGELRYECIQNLLEGVLFNHCILPILLEMSSKSRA